MSTTQKTAAEGKVDLGDLTATVLSALSSMSADARIGGGGVTVGLIVTPPSETLRISALSRLFRKARLFRRTMA